MKHVTLLSLALLSLGTSAFAAPTTYTCKDGDDSIQITLDDAGKAVFSDKSEQATEQDFNCLPPGKGGTLFAGGSGPNAWGYRIPNFVAPLPTVFALQFVWDEDSDGMACEYRTISCSVN
jgi:hypothetical protein